MTQSTTTSSSGPPHGAMLDDVGLPVEREPRMVRAQRGIGLFWVLLWLVWLLEPVADAWRRHDTRGWVGLVAVLLFAAGYIGHFLAFGPQPFSGREIRFRAPAVLTYVGLAALMVVSVAMLAQPATVTIVFLAIAGMWTWPQRVAVALASGLAVALAWMMWNLDGWEHDGGTLVGLAFGVVAVAVGMVAGRRRRELEAARVDNAQLMVFEERNRLSRDLHDIVGHSLTVIAIKAEVAERMATDDPERARHEMAEVQRLSRSALVDVQRAVEGYRELSLSGEIAHAHEVLHVAGITPDLPTATDEVPEDLRDLFAWTVREAVTNVVRHSRAGVCRIRLAADRVVIEDDGVGAEDLSNGRGLSGLRDRATAAGAVLSTAAVSPHGLRVQVTVPDMEGTR